MFAILWVYCHASKLLNGTSVMRFALFGTSQHQARDVRSPRRLQRSRRFVHRRACSHHIVYQHHALAAHGRYTFGRDPKRITHMV
jgi:hypothetical protein